MGSRVSQTPSSNPHSTTDQLYNQNNSLNFRKPQFLIIKEEHNNKTYDCCENVMKKACEEQSTVPRTKPMFPTPPFLSHWSPNSFKTHQGFDTINSLLHPSFSQVVHQIPSHTNKSGCRDPTAEQAQKTVPSPSSSLSNVLFARTHTHIDSIFTS